MHGRSLTLPGPARLAEFVRRKTEWPMDVEGSWAGTPEVPTAKCRSRRLGGTTRLNHEGTRIRTNRDGTHSGAGRPPEASTQAARWQNDADRTQGVDQAVSS